MQNRTSGFPSLTLLLVLLTFLIWFDKGIAVANTNQSSSPIQYRLSFRKAALNRVEVELTLPVEGKDELELMMPVWTPGSYLIREYARQVETISARDSVTNAAVTIEKTKKNRWKIPTAGLNEVVVEYTIYCHEMTVRSNWVEPEFAFVTGAATFITRVDALEREHIVRIDALPSWPKIATSLQSVNNNAWVRSAKNFDDLVDSPILLGDMDVQAFEVGGVPHYLATLGGDKLWDTVKAVEDVKKIVEAQHHFWGEVPYPEYWFINLATETRGGLEHDNSTVLMTSRWAMKQRSSYLDWLGLVSHEFFHTWNVRRLRPKSLIQYDFENEQYTQELWVAEGATSYYDDLFVVQSGLCSSQEYIDLINKVISGVQTTPGNTVQSLHDSSFDTWIKFYRPDENAHNSRISYYTKGSLAAMLLDVEIRVATNDEKTLQDVMRRLWAEHRQTGYTTEDVLRIANEVSGKDLTSWFANAIDEAKSPDYSSYFSWYGFEWKSDTPKDEKVKTQDGSGKELTAAPKKRAAYIGADVLNQQGKAILEKIISTGPAGIAGLTSGDELIAVDNYRVSPEGWSERLSMYQPEDVADFLISRRGRLLTISVKFGAPDSQTWTIQRVKEPTEIQQQHWKKLVGEN